MFDARIEAELEFQVKCRENDKNASEPLEKTSRNNRKFFFCSFYHTVCDKNMCEIVDIECMTLILLFHVILMWIYPV